MNERIYLSPPYMCGNEQKYVQDAFESNWVAPLGPNVTAFEKEMASYIGVNYAVATNAGTAAIHLALRCLGVSSGDIVFCSDLTFAGSCNPILYQHARPIFIDSEPDSYNMSPAALEDAFKWAKAHGNMPKAVIIVDLYGQSADYDALLPLCAQYGVPVLEDAAEAVGASYHGKLCGSFGMINIQSFNGNKIVNCSGGGMVLTDDESAAQKMLFWATQARSSAVHYEHEDYGYNYRLSNVSAGIGRGQLEALTWKMARRREIYENYVALFADDPVHMQPIFTEGTSNYWMSVAILDNAKASPIQICEALNAENIEARPAWKPMHMQPIFVSCPYFSHDAKDIGAALFEKGLCLPSGEALTLAQQERIATIVRRNQ